MEEQKEPAVEPVAHEAPSSSTARSLKDLVAQMILSEEKYGWELNKVITHFVDPFFGDQKLIGKVGRAEAETIFNRVTDLHKLHLKILEALQRKDLSLIPSSIGALDSQLDLFPDVIKQDSAAVNALRVAKNSRNFQAFLRPLQDTHGDLTHLLRTSHSRVTTYREFLQQFIHQCAVEGVSLTPDAHKALEILERKEEAVKEAKQFSVNQDTLLAIDAKLECNLRLQLGQEVYNFKLVSPHRQLVREGRLFKWGEWPPADPSVRLDDNEVYLFNDVLLWTLKTASFFKEKLKAIEVVQLCTIKDVQETPEAAPPHGFTLTKVDGTSMTWVCQTAEDKQSWIEKLKFCIYEAKQNQVFGVALGDLMISQREYGRYQPSLLENTTASLREPTMLYTEGLFRASGSASEIKGLANTLDTGIPIDFKQVTVHSVAGLLKLWIRCLPEPLLTWDLYEQFLEAIKSDKDEEILPNLKRVVAMLRPYNKFTLHSLITFLSEVAAQSEYNKMTKENLAIVFGPNLMVRKGAVGASGFEFQFANRVVLFLLHNHEQIFEGVEAERDEFVRGLKERREEAAQQEGGSAEAVKEGEEKRGE